MKKDFRYITNLHTVSIHKYFRVFVASKYVESTKSIVTDSYVKKNCVVLVGSILTYRFTVNRINQLRVFRR